MASDGVDVTCCGRPFQTRRAATGNARSPTVDSRVRRTLSDDDVAERRRRRASVSAGWQSSSARNDGAIYPLPTLVDKESQLIVDPLRRLQSMHLT